jgi:hypothetical protein
MFSPRMIWLGLVGVLILSGNVLAQSKESAMAQHISYRKVKVDGLSIFYREAGPKDAPALLLLHGLPSSSRMFEPLLTRLAGQTGRRANASASAGMGARTALVPRAGGGIS